MSSEAPSAKELEISAGGVMVRGDDVAVIVPRKKAADGRAVLALPKGHPDPGESLEQAAVREVREEAGVSGELQAKLGEVRYWYQRKGRRRAKRVTFYLFAYREGDVADHDHEVDEARWMPLRDARTALSYAGEREMVERALTALGR